MNNDLHMCRANLGSITYAMKAQKLLSAAAIPSTVIKQESAGRGCSYSLQFSCSQINNVKTVFANEKIKVKQWKEEN